MIPSVHRPSFASSMSFFSDHARALKLTSIAIGVIMVAVALGLNFSALQVSRPAIYSLLGLGASLTSIPLIVSFVQYCLKKWIFPKKEVEYVDRFWYQTKANQEDFAAIRGQIAKEVPQDDVIRLLFDAALNTDKCTPEFLYILRDSGISLPRRGNPLICAVLCGGEESLACMELIVGPNPEPFVNERQPGGIMGGSTPLHFAVLLRRNNEDEIQKKKVKFLLDRFADVSAKDARGNTPLHSAMLRVRGPNLEVITMLVDKGAKLDEKNGEGKTPVDLANEHKHEWDSSSQVIDFIQPKFQ